MQRCPCGDIRYRMMSKFCSSIAAEHLASPKAGRGACCRPEARADGKNAAGEGPLDEQNQHRHRRDWRTLR